MPKLLFEDQHLIVLSKPPGLLSQGEKTGDENLVDWLRAHVGRNYIGLVHRLDRNTSGLMVVAKRTKAARRLTDALQQGALKRMYLAWTFGDLKTSARWENWLLKDESTNRTRVWGPGSTHPPQAKKATLTATPKRKGLFHGQAITLVEFELETGRSHQIRAQSAFAGFPLVGDSKYGTTHSPLFSRPALHSHILVFPHPMSGEEMRFEEPLPQDLAALG